MTIRSKLPKCISTSRQSGKPFSGSDRCSVFLQAFRLGKPWFSIENAVLTPKDAKLLDPVIEHLENHLKSDCTCVRQINIHLLIAITHLNKFYYGANNVYQNTEQIIHKAKTEEAQQMQKKMEEAKKSYVNDIPKEGIDSSVCRIKDYGTATLANQRALLGPAILALQSFIEMFKSLDKIPSELYPLFWKSVNQLYLLVHLNSLFQVFTFYNMLFQAFKTLDVAFGLIRKLHVRFDSDATKMSEELKIIGANGLRFFLNIGAYENFKALLLSFFENTDFEKLKLDDFGNVLLYLVHTEYLVRRRKGKEQAAKLRQLMDGDYLAKRTIRRYLLKVYANIVATKYGSSAFAYSNSYSEFMDTYHNVVSLIKRYRVADMKGVATNEHDPLWVRYMTFNLYAEFSKIFFAFFQNSGLISDCGQHYVEHCQFYHQSMNIYELAKLNLQIATMDHQNGFNDDASKKLNVVYSLFHSFGDVNEDLFVHSTSTEKEDPDKSVEPLDILAQMDALTMEDKAIDVLKSEHNDLEFYQLRYPVENFDSLVILINDNMKTFSAHGSLFQDLFFLVLRYSHQQIVLSHFRTPDMHELLEAMFDMIEDYATTQYFEQFFNYPRMGFNTIKFSMENFIIANEVSYCYNFLSIEYVKCLIREQYYEKAVGFLSNSLAFSACDYVNRTLRSELIYLQAVAAYKIVKSDYVNPTKVFKLIYDAPSSQKAVCKLLEQALGTPPPASPPVSSRKRAPPKKIPPAAPVRAKKTAILTKETMNDLRRQCIESLDFFTPDYDDVRNAKPVYEFERGCNNRPTDFQEQFMEFNHFWQRKIFLLKAPFMVKLREEYEVCKEKLFENIIRLFAAKIFSYIGVHPSWILFEKCHMLLYKVAKMQGKPTLNLLYHFSEFCRSTPYRYRTMFVCARKNMGGVKVEEDVENYRFKDADYFPNDYMSRLPSTWRFIQIQYVPDAVEPYLLLSRYQTRRTTVLFKVKSECQPQFFNNILKEFEDIMKGNTLSFIEKDRRAYWTMRHSLDSRLRKLLMSFERVTISMFKAFFLGVIEDEQYKNAKRYFMQRILAKGTDVGLTCTDLGLFDVFAEASLFISKEEFFNGLELLFPGANETFFNYCDLVQVKAFNKNWPTEKAIQALYKNVGPVGLILCDKLVNFPVESLPTSRWLNQSFFRVPSLKIALTLYEKHMKDLQKRGASLDKNVYYLLNPQNNLKTTEELFKEKFAKLPEWKGVIGQEPKPEELMQHLQKDDVYLYIGHGSGQPYYRQLPSGGFESMKVRPISLIFGCSSGKSIDNGNLSEIYGVPYKFLINGSPCYIGNLWDVTDKDIDLFTNSFMQRWFKCWGEPDNKDPSLPRCISLSRDTCKLPFLIGSAPVVFGLPIIHASSQSN